MIRQSTPCCTSQDPDGGRHYAPVASQWYQTQHERVHQDGFLDGSGEALHAFLFMPCIRRSRGWFFPMVCRIHLQRSRRGWHACPGGRRFRRGWRGWRMSRDCGSFGGNSPCPDGLWLDDNELEWSGNMNKWSDSICSSHPVSNIVKRHLTHKLNQNGSTCRFNADTFWLDRYKVSAPNCGEHLHRKHIAAYKYLPHLNNRMGKILDETQIQPLCINRRKQI